MAIPEHSAATVSAIKLHIDEPLKHTLLYTAVCWDMSEQRALVVEHLVVESGTAPLHSYWPLGRSSSC